jgi:hypothetical protein
MSVDKKDNLQNSKPSNLESSLSRIGSSMCTSANSALNSIPADLVAGIVLRVVEYAIFHCIG